VGRHPLAARGRASARPQPGQHGQGPPERAALLVFVANVGTSPTTLHGAVLMEFRSLLARYRFRPSGIWDFSNQKFGEVLPTVLTPGQQWWSGVEQDADISAVLTSGRLYAVIYHVAAPTHPVVVRLKP
jgi:hypothetical protein